VSKALLLSVFPYISNSAASKSLTTYVSVVYDVPESSFKVSIFVYAVSTQSCKSLILFKFVVISAVWVFANKESISVCYASLTIFTLVISLVRCY